MKNRIFCICATSIFAASTFVGLVACQHAKVVSQSLRANPDWGALDRADDKVSAVVIPQWHLSPQTNTRTTTQKIPQTENQQAIYHQLVSWVQDEKIASVVVEGCRGEIDASGAGSNVDQTFNGWSLKDLEQASPQQLDAAITQVGIKLEAKFKTELKVLCGDDLDLIKRHQLVLSDLRGLVGFASRIAQFRNAPEKRAGYIKTLRELLKLPASQADAEVLEALNQNMQKKLGEFDEILKQRNAVFASAVKNAPHPVAIVIGALHVPDLENRLLTVGEQVAVFKPKGLAGDENELIEKLRALIKKSVP